MKTFLGRFLASFLALVVFSAIGGIILLVSLITIPFMLSQKPKTKLSAPAYILSIHADYLWTERAEHNATSKLKTVLGKERNWGISDFIKAIKLAQTDSNIQKIYIELGFNPNSYASIYQMRKALLNFKQSGKKIYAFARNMDQKSYLLATVADSIFLSNDAVFLWDGMGRNSVFFKGFLDKIGLDMQIFYAGKFKSATEPFRRTTMSEESKLQQREILDFFHDSMLASISKTRHISTQKLNEYADKLSLHNSAQAHNLGFVDGLRSWEELDEAMRQNMPEKTERLDIKKYLDYITQDNNTEQGNKAQIAVIYADGEIIPDGTGAVQDVAIEGIRFAKCIRKLAKNEAIKGVVLRINSPGGSVGASEEIYDALQFLHKSKPVVVSMGSVAASGGYYIACASDYIIADPYCITGSIGVFSMIPNIEGMLQKKLNLNFDGLKTNQNTFMGSDFSPAQKVFLQRQVEDIYYNFKSKVAQSRHLSLSAVENLAQGRVWTAPQAKKLGLVDELGGIEQAINKVVSLAKINPESYKLSSYPEPESLFEKLFSDSHYGIEILGRIYQFMHFQPHSISPENISNIIAQNYAKWAQISPKPQLLMRLPYDLEP